MNRFATFAALAVATILFACGTSEAPPEQAKLVAAPVHSEPPTATAESMKGLFVYMADAAQFTDCTNGGRFPVAMEGDYLALERTYLEQRSAAGAELMVSFEGTIEDRPAMEGGGVRATVVVDRFIAAHPDERCPSLSQASFGATRWALVQVGDQQVTIRGDRREPHLIFDPNTSTFKGYAGCNQITGSIVWEGDTLAFGPVASTKRYCQESMDLEQAVLGMLANVSAFTIDGDVIELRDGERVLARGEARYFD